MRGGDILYVRCTHSRSHIHTYVKRFLVNQLSVELRKLEDSIREVYTDMLMLQQREQEMRDISGASCVCKKKEKMQAVNNHSPH